MRSLRIVLLALFLSLVGHAILFWGIPYISFDSTPEISDDLVIKAELKPSPPKKILIARTKPVKNKSTTLANSGPAKSPVGEEGGGIEQQGIPFKLPSSGIIYYDSYVNGQPYQTGEIDWIADGGTYRLYINIPYAFVGPFVFESRGIIDAYGLAPIIYWSQRGARDPRYSRFDRNETGVGKMYFSDKPEYTPDIIRGTQDRFSLMFQMAALLNGDEKIDAPGSIRSIPVVDYNTLEMWHFKSYGESISDDVPSLGKSVNRHYALIQRESDPYKRQVDIWFSKDLEWLPGRIRAVESNGRVLELVFKQKNPLPIRVTP
jgi:hypothetical protein